MDRTQKAVDEKQKILVCGDVKGNFRQLFNKLQNINQKSGPFHLLLCVGDFFGADNSKLEAYKNGNLSIAVPTYVLGPNNATDTKCYENLENDEICPNLTYLGRRGLYTVASGQRIAYVSGTESSNKEDSHACHFNVDDVKSVANACLATGNAGEYRGVDILITSQWSAGVQKESKNSSHLLAWLSSEIKPRYHFCGMNDIYHEPPPFRNAARKDCQFELSTRFIALASVGNAAKNKFIYALNMMPVEKMRITDLIEKTTDEIPSPYDSMQFSVNNINRTDEAAQQFFYDMNAPNGRQNERNRGFNQKNKDFQPKRPRMMETDPEKCWFCLSSPSVEKHLVITMGDNFYIALAKGPIDKYHILILSITHIQSVSLLSEEDFAELEKFKNALRKFYDSRGLAVVFFERNYKSNHLFINVCPVDKSHEANIRHAFNDKADEYNLTFETLPKLTASTQLPERGPYFHAELPDDTTLICRQMKQFPINFGREAVLLLLENGEEKINWRDCLLSKENEIELVKKFRQDFEPFDFTDM